VRVGTAWSRREEGWKSSSVEMDELRMSARGPAGRWRSVVVVNDAEVISLEARR
jgi:hypothetical protein